MPFNKSQVFDELFDNFIEKNTEVDALIVSDRDGLIIAGKTSKDVNMEIVSVLTAIVNPILERIRNEFAFKKFGTASFDTDEYRLLFISVDENITLSLVLNTMASVDKISPYAYFLAEKTAQIMGAEEDDNIQVKIPNFECEGETPERLKNQIYQMRLDTGGIYRFKFIIIGDHEVGKTSIVRQYVDKKFSKDYRATIGLNILAHTFNFLDNEINLSLWDVGAQSYFKRFRRTYYMGSQAVFIVFDLTNRQTYENVKEWQSELSEFTTVLDLPIIIVGNKTDLNEQRAVSYQEGVALATELSEKWDLKMSYIETSALTGENVDDAFSLISYKYMQKSVEIEENIIKKEIFTKIMNVIKEKGKLNLTLISYSQFWNPTLQILTEIDELGKYDELHISPSEKTIKFENGLLIKNFVYNKASGKNSDGIFCIFDGRDKNEIDVEWRDLLIKLIEECKENVIILAGIRVTDKTNYSLLIEQFNINEYLEKKIVSVLFFKMVESYLLEIHDQLNTMLSTIENF